MAMVMWMAAAYQRTLSQSQLAWSDSWWPSVMHQTNQVKSRNGFSHHDSTINTVEIFFIIINN